MAEPIQLTGIFALILVLASFSAVFRRVTNDKDFAMVGFLAACAMLGTALLADPHHPYIWNAPGCLAFGFLPITFRLDLLSAVFLCLLSVVSIANSFFAPGYLNHLIYRIHRGQFWCAYFLFVLSMALVFLSGDAITFIVFWELMSLSSVALVAAEHKLHKVQRAALVYLGATRIATAFIASGFLVMHSFTGSWNFVDWHFDSARTYLPALLIFIGFCIKAGIWPFHIWLPHAHPVAPSPVSALMSGVMVKVAVYGIVRILVLGDLNSQPLAYLCLFLGTVSAFWGVLFALVQHDLKRLLAYSTVENVGLILMAIAMALLSKSNGLLELASIAFAAAILHCLNHGLFKSLLFLGAGCVDANAHSREFGRLGGLAKKMPWTMACFLAGSAAICALPPTNGFAGKYLIYQSLFVTVWQSSSLIDRGICLAVIGVLAVVSGLALACFTKAIAVTFLGNPRSKSAEESQEGSWSMIVPQVFLAGSCFALGVLIPQILHVLKPLCDEFIHKPCRVETAFALPMACLAVALIAIVLLIYALLLNTSKVRKFITWECGFGDLSSRTQVTSDSFSQPVARIFSPILRYTVAFEIRGKDRRHFPEEIRVEPNMVSILEQRIYLPAVKLIGFSAKAMAKIQAGSIHLYLVYLCFTVILLLLLGTRL